jgi:hypothetical protein
MVKAIDVHVHPPDASGVSLTSSEETQRYFRAAAPPKSAEEMADLYAELDLFGVLLNIDAETATGRPPTPNDYYADLVKRYPTQFVAFGGVDPLKGEAAVSEARRCAEDLGMRGLKLMPNMGRFYPNDEAFYPLWETAERLGLVVLIHTGTTGVGAGHPGGGGVRLKYSRPIPYIDDIAANFPALNIIMAHPSWPWQEEQLAMLVHKPNVYMDLSGWSPKYFSPSLITYANNMISDKVIFGSDYPAITPERWLRDFEGAGFRDDVKPKILRENAARLLGIA